MNAKTLEFKLPALAENIETATVTKVLVSVGDAVAVDQPVLEIETDKAAAEVPSSVSGTITELLVNEGDTVKVGAVVFRATGQDAAPAPKADAPVAAEVPAEPARPAEMPAPVEPDSAGPAPAPKRSGAPGVAAPSVRRLARELGVDLSEVTGSGADGRITADDVKAHAAGAGAAEAGASGPGESRTTSVESLPDFARWGEIERQPMSAIRRRTAENMARAWATVPHVTQFDKADVTELERLRKEHGKKVEAAGGKLTVTAVIVKVLASALKKSPQFNASVDVAANEVVFKKYYNVGVAVDTERGLLVPVIRDVDTKNVTQIAVELGALAERARNRKLTLDEMQGGTFTVSNLGGIGGTGFTPIVNAPEVAILGVSRSQVEAVFVEGGVEPRTMLPLSLSYDHRVIDGADGARFLRWVVEALEQPFLATLEG
ncbi:MAG: 2-oxo acid dehydrogenase subunit E2 [Candidatus Hydrogenedentes bacterium]|nr:2-oxo acid dehydrogenase subunit E2 [Candidatus Hydrogenedentota bacterium]